MELIDTHLPRVRYIHTAEMRWQVSHNREAPRRRPALLTYTDTMSERRDKTRWTCVRACVRASGIYLGLAAGRLRLRLRPRMAPRLHRTVPYRTVPYRTVTEMIRVYVDVDTCGGYLSGTCVLYLGEGYIYPWIYGYVLYVCTYRRMYVCISDKSRSEYLLYL